MSESVKWSERPETTEGWVQYGPDGAEWGEREGRFEEVRFERCAPFELYSCTLCSALVSTEGNAGEIHTDYHRSHGE